MNKKEVESNFFPIAQNQTALPLASSSPLTLLSLIPEEEVWLAKQKSPRTRKAYRQDVAHFMKTLFITSLDELRSVDHRAVIAWERIMREEEKCESSTVRRRLSSLSSLSMV